MNKMTEEEEVFFEKELDTMLMARKDTLKFLTSNEKWYKKRGSTIAYGVLLAVIELVLGQMDSKEDARKLLESVLRDGFDKNIMLFTEGDLND